MASDKHVESNHRKHRRSYSPSDEADKHSKRHKHRHHKHGHRHHREKKHDDEIQFGDDDIAVKDVSPSLGDHTGVDMEEGEILGGNFEKKLESGDTKSAQFRENNLVVHVDKEQEGSKHREKKREREIEADRGRRKGRGSIDGDKRRERERDYRRDRDNDRGRSRDRARYSSRERGKEYERERRTEKDRNKGREIRSDRERYRNGDDGNGEVRHKQSGHSRHDAEDDFKIKSLNSSKDGNSIETKGNDERSRSDSDQNDIDEDVVWEPEEGEDEELSRVKESMRRMQEIMEKCKKKSEQENGISCHDKVKDLELADTPKQFPNAVDVPGSVSPGPSASAVIAGSDIDTIGGDVAKLSTTVREPDSDRTLARAGLGEGIPESERSDDMFRDDIFGESPAGSEKMDYVRRKGDGHRIVRSGLHDNWDDAEGYYSYQFGELLDGRYEIMATHGKGVFSNVVRAKDTKAELVEPEEVAIKIIRNNEIMHKAGQTEVQILKKLAGADPENKRHCVRFLLSFKYRNHLCLVFESLHLNLREVLKKFGRNIGLKLSAVRLYAMQLFRALKHLKNCGVLHCDIKPDNMLVNEDKNVLKLCDFGSAMFAGKNEVTPYLVSRFYRAPEIILGLPYDHPLDIWSVGCCLYEIYSGKVLFPGSTNSDMLRLHMELKGPFPKKMLRKGAFIDQHFDQDLNFYATEEDSVTGKTIKRVMVNIKPKDFGSVIKGYSGEDPKVLVHFRDLLEKIFILDPEKRLTVSQALAHPFITGK